MAISYGGELKVGLLEYLEQAEADDTLLECLTHIHEDNLEGKWQWSGRNHSRWEMNWRIMQNRHIKPKDNRIPWPIENHGWSMVESVRPTWGDNPPQFNVVPLRPGLEAKTPAMRTLVRWVEWRAKVQDFWEHLFDYLPPLGTVGGKALWDSTAAGGGGPMLGVLDPRSIASDVTGRLHHRNSRIIETTHLVEVGELKSLYPEFADKISVKPPTEGGDGGRDRNVTLARDHDSDGRRIGSKSSERMAEVVEMWIRADIDPVAEDALKEQGEEGEEQVDPAKQRDDQTYLVYTFIIGAGVIKKETVYSGLQIGTGQCWRNADSIFGWADFDMIAGLIIASNQLHIRAHSHRLACVAPPLLLPRTSGLTRRQVSGRPGSIWEVADENVAKGVGWMDVKGPSRDTLEYIAEQPQIMRRLLGIDELTPDFFNREQTAAATAMVLAALENRTRQRIRNMRPMVEDLMRVLVRLSIEHQATGIAVPRFGAEGVDELGFEELKDLNMNDFAIVSNLGKPGPLSRQARSAAVDKLYSSGVMNPMNPNPLIMREVVVEESDVPRKPEFILELRSQEQQKKAQQEMMQQQALLAGAGSPPPPSGGPGLPGGGPPSPTQPAPAEVGQDFQPTAPPPAAVASVASIPNFRGLR